MTTSEITKNVNKPKVRLPYVDFDGSALNDLKLRVSSYKPTISCKQNESLKYARTEKFWIIIVYTTIFWNIVSIKRCACNMTLIKKIKKAFNVYNVPYEVKPPYTHMVQIGDPVLRTSSKIVLKQNIQSSATQKLIETMVKIMKNDTLCGISAPQIGVPLRIIAMQCPEEFLVKLFPSGEIGERKMATMEPRVWINPEMKILDYDTNIEPEMCGSILSFQADVKRFNAVQLSGFDERGQNQKVEATGYLARIIQHEMDHLNGILYTDLMTPKTLQCCAWKEINVLNGYVELNYYPKA